MYLDEVAPLLRHPYLLCYYLASMGLSFLASVAFDGPTRTGSDPSFALLIPILVLATLVGIATFTGWVFLSALLRPAADPLTVYESLPIALSVVAVQTTTSVLWNLILGVPAPSPLALALSLLAVYVCDEIIICAWLRPNAARILDDIRTFKGSLPQRLPDSAATTPTGPRVVAGAFTRPAGSILHLQARGNHVQVWTDTDTQQVPGPLSSLIAQLPEHLGCLVHRSEWVATRAVTSARREGRATELVLSNGTLVRVASTRAGAVRDWLAQFDARFNAKPARRRPQSSAGGDTKRQSRPAPDTTTSATGASDPSAPSAPAKPSAN